MNARRLVLVVGDDPHRFKPLVRELERAGYPTVQADTIHAVWRQVYERHPSAIVILALPQGAFARPVDLCRELANHTRSILVLLLPARSRRMRTQAFASSVDQCFSFPGCSEELIAYLDARNRALGPALNDPRRLTAAPDSLQVDTPNRRIQCNGRFIDLTNQEWAMLMLLAHHEGDVVRIRDISRNLWRSSDRPRAVASLKHCIMRLRKKIETDPRKPKYVVTVRGLGYRLERAAPIPLPQTSAAGKSAPN